MIGKFDCTLSKASSIWDLSSTRLWQLGAKNRSAYSKIGNWAIKLITQKYNKPRDFF